ncbi:MAG: malate dehydrogenase [Elusimicrobiales bacterium]|nr:malate dehydrogenase [Elusimicrobiales bacterium]
MNRRKVTVVGAGHVGESVVRALAEKDLADIVLVDIPATENMPAGKALDIMQTGPIYGYDTNVTGATSYESTAGSDIVVITAGIPRKPGMSRDDLLNTNAAIVKSVTEQVIKYSPDSILIIVSNPLDAMCQVALQASKFPKNRVIGMAGILDSSRMRTFIAQALNVSTENVHAMVLGGHGDTMVPLPRFSTVAGIPITELMTKEQIDAINTRTCNGGAEIVKLLKTGSAYYAPAAAAVEMVAAILLDKNKVVPCAAYLEGEYGVSGIFVGVPVKLGSKGIVQILELKLSEDEKAALLKSAASVKELCGVLK